jgi:hypothetical protein
MSVEAARLVVQLALGLVFLLSTAGKLRHPAAFVRGVAEFEILPASLAYAFGVLLIPAEAFLAAAHLAGWGMAVAVPLGTAVLLAFLVAVAVNLRRNRDLLCHCFDSLGGERVSVRSAAQLLLLLSGELFLLASAAGRGGGSILRERSLEELALAGFWAAFCLLGGLWLLRADEVWALFRPYRCKTCSEPPAGQPAA